MLEIPSQNHLPFFLVIMSPITNPTISPSQKWWQIILEIEISCSQWEGSTSTHDGPWFFLSRGSLGGGKFFFVFLPCSISSPTINLSQKWWPTILEIKNMCIQWVGWSMHSRCFDFFLLSFGWKGWGEDFFSFYLCSLYVTFKFQVSCH